jgi:hypothetical protein
LSREAFFKKRESAAGVVNRIELMSKPKQFMKRFLPLFGLAAVAGLIAVAQDNEEAAPEVNPETDYGTINLATTLGSFRAIDGEGEIEGSFEGTVLFSRVDGDLEVTGEVRKEYENEELQRVLYTGNGSFRVDGSWRGIQWFGKNMRATMFGKGVIRVDGEYDRNLETGWYWFDDQTDDRRPWPAEGTIDLRVPEIRPGGLGNVTPQRRDSDS